ncbi:MAG TPA: hypothetical protein PLM06_11230 [Anaerolineae bacterium]|nr:hypothetical protein [Anaerolineae bacterium]
MEPTSAPEHLNPWIGPWEGGWFLVPLTAVLGGAWTVARPLDAETLPQLALAGGVALIAWAPLWRALTYTDWKTPLHTWRDWDARAPVPALPFTQPGAPGATLTRALEHARAWWLAQGRTALALPLGSALLAWVAGVLLSLPLGRTALLLTLLHGAWAQLLALWSEGRGRPGPLGEAVALGGLPWLLGATLGQSSLPLGSALAVIALLGLYAIPGVPAFLGPLLAAGYLLWQGQPLATGVLLLLALPGLLLLTQRLPAPHYRRAIAFWLMAMLLLMGWVL